MHTPLILFCSIVALGCGSAPPPETAERAETAETAPPITQSSLRHIGPCRSDAECGGHMSCVPPGTPHACGIPCMAVRDCESAADCSGGQACAEFAGGCCFRGERGTRCAPRCTDATCPEGERCDGASGSCVIALCDGAYSCPSRTSCRRGDPNADVHGCVRDACAADAECGSGACVSGRCYDGPGACQGPAA